MSALYFLPAVITAVVFNRERWSAFVIIVTLLAAALLHVFATPLTRRKPRWVPSPTAERALVSILKVLGVYLILPYLLVLTLLRPWRHTEGGRKLAEGLLGPMLPLNPAVGIAPLIGAAYLAWGTAAAVVTGIIIYIVVVVIFHSMIYHGSQFFLARWSKGLPFSLKG